MRNGEELRVDEIARLRDILRAWPLLESRFPRNQIVSVPEGHVHELMRVLLEKGDLLGYGTQPVRIPVGTVEASLLEVLDSDDEGIAWVPPNACRVYHSSSQAISTGTWQSLAFDSERLDSNELHDPASNNERITVALAGLYAVGGAISFAASAAGNARGARLRVNGSTVIAQVLIPPVGGGTLGTTLNLSTQYELAANDYIELQAYHDIGSDLNVYALSNFSPEFWAYRLGGAGVTPVVHVNTLTLNWIE